MKKLFIFCLGIMPFFSNAQSNVWIDTGAVWHYDQSFIGYLGFLKYKYVGDQMMGGELCQKIEQKKYSFANIGPPTFEIGFIDSSLQETYYTYVSGDTVFYYNNGEFFVLYDFGASPGDSWIISTTSSTGDPFCNDTSWVEVVDTGSTVFNSVTYRTIDLAPVGNSAMGLYGRYVERFGLYNPGTSFFYLFPRGMTCDTNVIVDYYFTNFVCFEDESFNLLNPSGEDCEYLLTHLGQDENNLIDFKIYPNPVDEQFTIELAGSAELKLYSSEGKVVLIQTVNSKALIDVSNFTMGIYVLEVKDQSGKVSRKKLILND